MALTFLSNTNDSISFEEFIDFLKGQISFNDEDSLLECTNMLFKMSNNNVFFIDFLNKQLSSNLLEFQKNNLYSEQSYMLYDSDAFFVRMTYWPILSDNLKVKESQNELFSYGLIHDHNFPLLTAGYKGDGYITKLWEYDYEKVIGYENESVEIKFLEETTLNKGKALYYRPSKDIHAQFAPRQENSLAINIILRSLKSFNNRQYEFDVENKKIKRIIYGATSTNYNLIKLSSFINNTSTVDILLKLAESHHIPFIRRECLEALYSIEKSKDIWKIGLKDLDKRVSIYSKQRIES